MLALCMGLGASAQQTKLMVRAKAKDAKFIGSSIGGAHVMIKDATTDRILAEGMTTGSTGNTDLIMKTPKERHGVQSDLDTAGFLATLDLEDPVFVTVEAFAPFHRKNAMTKASTQLWLIPGKDILGDGIVLEFPGFVVDILAPNTHQYIPLKSVAQGLDVKANIVMMCGCPIEKGGIWDSEGMEVKAKVKKDGKPITTLALENPTRNHFEGKLEIMEAGNYEITVYAYDPRTGNTGLDRLNYVVTD